MKSEPRFVAQSRHDGFKWGVWDNRLGRWADKWFTVHPRRAVSRADYLNRATSEAGDMSTSDGLGA